MQSPEYPSRPPRRPLTGWTLLIPVLLAGGAILARTQEPSAVIQQSMSGSASPEPTPTSALEPTPTAKKQKPESGGSSHSDEVSIMFVPGEDGKLHRHKVKALDIKAEEMPTAPSTYTRLVISNALEELFETAPEYFPKGAKVADITVPDLPDKPIIVNMRKGFENPDFWQGEETTTTALDAIVNTVVANSDADSSNQKVLFHVDGKPIVTLGEMDTRDPFEADPDLAGKS